MFDFSLARTKALTRSTEQGQINVQPNAVQTNKQRSKQREDWTTPMGSRKPNSNTFEAPLMSGRRRYRDSLQRPSHSLLKALAGFTPDHRRSFSLLGHSVSQCCMLVRRLFGLFSLEFSHWNWFLLLDQCCIFPLNEFVTWRVIVAEFPLHKDKQARKQANKTHRKQHTSTLPAKVTSKIVGINTATITFLWQFMANWKRKFLER